jgi:hypothetical protein
MRILAVLLCCSSLSGCLGFGYPSFTETPRIDLEEPDVQAFRVVSDFKQWGPLITGPIECSLQLEILPRSRNAVARQTDSYFSYFYVAFPFEGGHSRSLEVRLYRRGYQTVRIPAHSWLAFSERETRPKWVQLEKLEDLENAIEQIAPARWDHSLGSKEVRQFVAREYTWLAHSGWAAGPDREKDLQRLLEKAAEYENEPRLAKE